MFIVQNGAEVRDFFFKFEKVVAVPGKRGGEVQEASGDLMHMHASPKSAFFPPRKKVESRYGVLLGSSKIINLLHTNGRQLKALLV